jgi:hypothetical protein
VIFEPVDFIAKLAALVPKPRVNLTRFDVVFAPNSLHRVWVAPARRGKGSPNLAADQDEKTPAQRHVAMTWAQRLKRVFNIDVETCRVCGAAAKIIACIEDPAVIRKIPGVLGMQNVLNGVSMAVGVMEMALYSSYTLFDDVNRILEYRRYRHP